MRRLKIPLGSLGVALVPLILWQSLSYPYSLASPVDIARIIISGFSEGWLIPHAESTFASVGVGFALAVSLGFGVGFLLGSYAFWRGVFEPLVVALFAVPKIVLFPLFLFSLGIGFNSQVAMALLHGIFPMIIETVTGVREVNPTLVKVGRSMNASSGQLIGKVFLPSMALPFVVGLRMAFSLAIVGVVLAELFAAKMGMGLLIMRAYHVLDIPRMLALILFLFAVAFAGNLFLWSVERRLRRR